MWEGCSGDGIAFRDSRQEEAARVCRDTVADCRPDDVEQKNIDKPADRQCRAAFLVDSETIVRHRVLSVKRAWVYEIALREGVAGYVLP
ncbi:hypothetical protein ATK17_3208 [Branchiibius hedensis]|uniref:Uncharacterized protein n=1 Tax=Branchiibius hedensis TaxID=672460 RepID=A0A2Y9C2C0_9MICO|nr:hypothetical protein ATK17_3208 [Branchiibius hedensis]SSA35833.1 hypothetical protein SAMN04489750_3208 [Branchiibius hedensis]